MSAENFMSKNGSSTSLRRGDVSPPHMGLLEQKKVAPQGGVIFDATQFLTNSAEFYRSFIQFLIHKIPPRGL